MAMKIKPKPTKPSPKRDVISVRDTDDPNVFHVYPTDMLIYIDGGAVVNVRAVNGQLVIRCMGKAAIQPEATNMFTLEFKP
jgi:membrane protease subunit (stomatin/prohibitin family)